MGIFGTISQKLFKKDQYDKNIEDLADTDIKLGKQPLGLVLKDPEHYHADLAFTQYNGFDRTNLAHKTREQDPTRGQWIPMDDMNNAPVTFTEDGTDATVAISATGLVTVTEGATEDYRNLTGTVDTGYEVRIQCIRVVTGDCADDAIAGALGHLDTDGDEVSAYSGIFSAMGNATKYLNTILYNDAKYHIIVQDIYGPGEAFNIELSKKIDNTKTQAFRFSLLVREVDS